MQAPHHRTVAFLLRRVLCERPVQGEGREGKLRQQRGLSISTADFPRTLSHYVSTLTSGLSMETKCEDTRTSQCSGVSLSFASLWLRPRTSPTIQWVIIPPCPSACHLNTCFGPRGFEPPHPAHPNSVLSRVSGTLTPWAWPAFQRAQRVEKYFGRICAQPRNGRGLCHSWSHVMWSKPHHQRLRHLHTPGEALWSGIFPQDGTCLSCCCSLSLFPDCFRKVNGIEKSGSHQLKPRVPST